MDYGLWADVIGIVHALFVLFVVGGQGMILAGWGLAWGWTKNRIFRLAHLATIGFVVVQQWLGELCPLTAWETEFRHRAGAEGLGESFIQYWLDRLLYFSAPTWMFTVLYTAFGALVIATFVFHPPRKRPKFNQDPPCPGHGR